MTDRVGHQNREPVIGRIEGERQPQTNKATIIGVLGAILTLWGGYAANQYESAGGLLMALLGIGLVITAVVFRLRA